MQIELAMTEVIKEYVRYLLNNHMDKIVDDFVTLLKDYQACEIWDTGQSEAEIHLRYRSKIYDYLEGIYSNSFIETEYLLKKWNAYRLSTNNPDNIILPQNIIESYMLLHGILKSYLEFYTNDITSHHLIVQNLDNLELAVEEMVIQEFQIIKNRAYSND
jgi:hypothetical protein